MHSNDASLYYEMVAGFHCVVELVICIEEGMICLEAGAVVMFIAKVTY